MHFDFLKVYNYYKNNLNKACDKRELNFQEFRNYFIQWLNLLQYLPYDIKDLAEENKCGKFRFFNYDSVIDKINKL